MKILSGILFSGLVLISLTSFASDDTMGSNANSSSASSSSNANTPKTSMGSNWVCTTNASSSEKRADQDADKKMSDHAASAAKSFAFAQKHCRDCTQITCNVKK
ncbi:Uncharacterised protein [Legionella steigerwaltii]|uniref:Uncharacterized protein n=1 Tax=Legionella steigerwaltii TaxID=460 RepID=A0A378L8J2_9GAMM|nr:hypothetical protein [Legionella steigerwaltii]KTD78031.1 hypothetical protein Lstg_1312 [Legionella steigerwaltii]STY22232.1 Uncharacterised protein [Legionella steigerwaltii]